MEHHVGLDVSLKLTAILHCRSNRKDRARRGSSIRPGGDCGIHQVVCAACRADRAQCISAYRRDINSEAGISSGAKLPVDRPPRDVFDSPSSTATQRNRMKGEN